MKIKLASFKEKEEGTALANFGVLDDDGNYLSDFYLLYVVVYNQNKELANTYQLYNRYFERTKEEIYLDDIDWGHMESDSYKALTAFDKKYGIE